jgi:hypothetical protein
MSEEKVFHWERHPAAEALQVVLLNKALNKNSFLSSLDRDLHRLTSTRVFDWIDHFAVVYSDQVAGSLVEREFEREDVPSEGIVYYHPGALLPRIVLTKNTAKTPLAVFIKVDYVADFLQVHALSLPIQGSLFSGYRRALISSENQVECWVCERRGTRTLLPVSEALPYLERYLTAREKWQTRIRRHEDEDYIMNVLLDLVDELVGLVGMDMAAHIIMEGERAYWQSRNSAGQIQKARQDRLGMGWANHDHHTFRSSRRHFPNLVRLFETVGFHCREKFYAGAEAGWGAQVMENPRSGHVLFLDLDLATEELHLDFAHQRLADLDRLGTVGLWCALHGDSILQAGMHHLEAQFNFDDLTQDLSRQGIESMPAFSNFSYLKQAFTKGEVWPVETARVHALVEKKLLSLEEADRFKSQGALGSHLENLQRREGYKGFNQKNVSDIIKRTDPRAIFV